MYSPLLKFVVTFYFVYSIFFLLASSYKKTKKKKKLAFVLKCLSQGFISIFIQKTVLLFVSICFLGWEWQQHIYKFIPLPWNALSWTEAKIYCKEMEGGHLLSIRTPRESRWVTDRIRQIRRVIGFSKFWIGASDFGHEGIYQWSDDNTNRPVNFTRYRDT